MWIDVADHADLVPLYFTASKDEVACKHCKTIFQGLVPPPHECTAMVCSWCTPGTPGVSHGVCPKHFLSMANAM